jgi:hypothetical protein
LIEKPQRAGRAHERLSAPLLQQKQRMILRAAAA